jgi:protein O-GlcNAc transferase
MAINPLAAHYINAAHAANQKQDFAQARQLCEMALAMAPQVAEAWFNLGKAAAGLRQKAEAQRALYRARDLVGSSGDALNSIGLLLLELGDLAEAENCLRRAIQLSPQSAAPLSNLGKLCHLQGRFKEEESLLRQAIALQPQLAPLYMNLGLVLMDTRRAEAAAQAFERAIELDPKLPIAWRGWGFACLQQKQREQGIAHLKKALELDPQLELVHGAMLITRLTACDWQDLEPFVTEMQGHIARQHMVATPWTLLSVMDDCAQMLRAARTTTQRNFPTSDQPVCCNTPRSGKIRVAYFSGDLRTHPVAQLLLDQIEALDRSRFELHAYSFRKVSDDAMQARARRAFDVFVDADDLEEPALLDHIAQAELDIAIDLSGHTEGNRLDLFAKRLAPIQASYLGYAGTSGSSFIDYLIADKTVCPPESLPHYSEKLVWLPQCFMPHDNAQPISDRAFTRAEFGLPESGFVFCCFNNHYKLNPTTFDVWMRLLKSIPGSVIWLSDAPSEVKDNLSREAKNRGVEASRIVYAPRMPDMAEHLARYRLADLFIDTFPYNAHTTACDALWAGVPVLTYAGRSFASRVAASLLQSVGPPELITHSLQDYEALALALARDPQRLAALRERLAANRLSSPLFDTPALARHMEAAFSSMVDRQRKKLPPELIDLTATTTQA